MITEKTASLVFAHIGDLHLTGAKEQNYKDLLAIVAELETGGASTIDMVYLPGDNADHGHPHSYQLLATALKMLSVPVYAISGDHDMEPHHLNNLYAMPGTKQMPFAIHLNNTCCLFVDVCGNGSGGPDFRLGKEQITWLQQQAAQATKNGTPIVLFMHTFPDDLKDEREKEAVNRLIAENNVVLVDMGHTHYNEIANDGHTIFTATRSTGQIEEGPVGYSLISVYKNVVSWRFKLLDEPFPFVMITYPAAHRLATNQSQKNKIDEIRAVVMADKKIKEVLCRLNEGDWVPMSFSKKERCWILPVHFTQDKKVKITVMAKDEAGRPGMHSIVYTSLIENLENKQRKFGSDDFSIGAWPENHIMGTQLGPNRNAKPIK